MKAVLQRVTRASVSVEGEVVGSIGRGLLVFLGVMKGDTIQEARWLAQKVSSLRCFENEAGRMDISLASLVEQGEAVGVLVVSQFTLAADGRRGRRPSFDGAAPPADARPLYEAFCAFLEDAGLSVATGRFQETMEVELVNSGPATFVLEDPHPARSAPLDHLSEMPEKAP